MTARLTLGALLLALAAAAYQLYPRSVCERVLPYDLGRLDERFKVRPDAVLEAARAAAELWEEAAGRKLFTYEPGAAFTIQLHYDERQKTALEAKAQRAGIETSHQEVEELRGRYESLRYAYEAQKQEYERQVSAWNAKGGAPPAELERLGREREQLKSMSDQLNAFAAQHSPLVSALESELKSLNAKAGRPFDRGDFTGSKIDVYQFDDEKDLTLILVHEFGHALTLSHVANPEAVMHFARNERNFKELRLTEDDRKALTLACERKTLLDPRRR